MIDFRTFPLLFGFMVLINVSFGVINSGLEINSVSPFGTNLTSVETPNFYNASDNSLSLTANMTNPSQHGINNASQILSFDWFVDYIDVALASLQFGWLLISGGFINDFLNVIGYPSYFVNALYVIIGICAFFWIGYKITGKE